MIKSLVINNTRRMISYIATVLFLERDWSRKRYRCRSPQVSAGASPYFQAQHGSWTPLIFWLMQFIIFIVRQRVANRNAWLKTVACVNANISNYSSLLPFVLLWDRPDILRLSSPVQVLRCPYDQVFWYTANVTGTTEYTVRGFRQADTKQYIVRL